MAIQCSGHYENGSYILEGMPNIPAGRVPFTITFHGVEEAIPAKSDLQRHKEAFEEFFEAIAAIEDEPITDEMLCDLQSRRINTKRTLE